MSGSSPSPGDADADPDGLGPALTWRPLPINAARGGFTAEQLVLSNSDLVSLIVLNMSGDVNEFQRMKHVNRAFARGVRRFLASRNSMPVWQRSMHRFQGEVLAVNDGNFRRRYKDLALAEKNRPTGTNCLQCHKWILDSKRSSPCVFHPGPITRRDAGPQDLTARRPKMIEVYECCGKEIPMCMMVRRQTSNLPGCVTARHKFPPT